MCAMIFFIKFYLNKQRPNIVANIKKVVSLTNPLCKIRCASFDKILLVLGFGKLKHIMLHCVKQSLFFCQIRRILLIVCGCWSWWLNFAFNYTDKQFCREQPNLKIGNKGEWHCPPWYTDSLHYCVNCITFLT